MENRVGRNGAMSIGGVSPFTIAVMASPDPGAILNGFFHQVGVAGALFLRLSETIWIIVSFCKRVLL